MCVVQTSGCIWNWVSTSIHTVETVQFIVQTSGVFFRSNFGSQPQMQGRKYEELQFLILLIRNCFAIASNKTPRIIFRYNNEDDIQCYSKKNTILDLCLNLWNSCSIIITWLPFWGGVGGGHTPGNLLFTHDSNTTTLNLFLYLNMYLDICILASDYLTSVIVHCLMTCQASPCSFKLICHILRVLSFDPVANHLPSGENAQQTTYLEINAPTQGDEPQSFTQQTFKGPSEL